MASTSYFADRPVAPSTDSILSPVSPNSSAAPSSRSNALQNRITAVLAASYADLDIRQTLGLLDDRNLQNTPGTRRALRLDVQHELISCNAAIVDDFGQVASQLQRIGAAIATLNDSCARMRTHMTAAQRNTGALLDDARTILDSKQQGVAKQKLFNALQAHYILSDSDVAALTSVAEPVNDEFFQVLGRTKQIHEDCQVLLGVENQRLGRDILEQSSRHLKAAFQKLFRWVQRELKALDLENVQINSAIRRAIWTLAERPSLFQTCMDSFAETREQFLSNNFYAALIGAPVDSDHPIMGKAIELSAHDPLRYVSDMLAWTHSATVSEREALEVLFISDDGQIAKNMQTGRGNEIWARASPEDDGQALPFDGRKALNELMGRNLTGVLHQLKQRTEQVIHSHQDATLAYKISALVAFYANTFTGLLGEIPVISETLRPLSSTAIRAFQSSMHDHVAGLQTDLTIPTDDLAAPEFLLDALETLRTLMQSFDTSYVHMNRAQRTEEFQPILQAALDPYVLGFENIAKRMRSPNSEIFALNCLFLTRESLAVYTFADRSEDLQSRIDVYEIQLADAVHTWFLQQSGIHILVDSIASPNDLTSSYKDPAQLASIAQQLDAFLPTATDDARAFLVQLDNKMLARRVIDHASEQFCDDFEAVKGLILQADEAHVVQVNGDSEDISLAEVFPRTGDEIRVLLS